MWIVVTHETDCLRQDTVKWATLTRLHFMSVPMRKGKLEGVGSAAMVKETDVKTNK